MVADSAPAYLNLAHNDHCGDPVICDGTNKTVGSLTGESDLWILRVRPVFGSRNHSMPSRVQAD